MTNFHAVFDPRLTKQCARCRGFKVESEFSESQWNKSNGRYCRGDGKASARQSYHANLEKNRQKNRDRYKADPERAKAYQRQYKKDHPLKYKGQRLKESGWTLEQYQQFMEKQNGLCAVCSRPPAATHNYNKWLYVDHCHKTGQARGLLCNSCNTALGCVDDDVERLTKMIDYLKDAPKCHQSAGGLL